jgi:cytochrome c oxidase subunit 2
MTMQRTNNPLTGLLAALLLAVALPAAGQDGQAAYATCVACHGASAEGNAALKAPRLNHLAPVYLSAQLQKFKAGIRGGEGSSVTARQMAPMAATLADDAAVAAVSEYIAGLESDTSPATVEGDAALGADYYNQFCGACHGASAEGNLALNSPRLAGSDDWYLGEQVRAFRTGERGAHPDDRTGKQMRAMAMVLPSDQAVADVVAFIRSLSE